MIGVLFVCSHSHRFDPDKATSPRCPSCDATQIARVLEARAPRITGHATGPLVETRALGPAAVNVAEHGPLTLKGDL